EVLHRVVVVARVVLLHAVGKLLLRALAQRRLADLRDRYGLVGIRLRQLGARGREQGRGQRRVTQGGSVCAHWNLCLRVISSRAFTSTFSVWAGKVVLRNSILYLPGSSLMNFFGGDTPWDLPFT